MEAYKIGVSILLSNGMSPVLSLISRELMGIHAKTKDIENNFKKWGPALGGVAAVMAGGAIVKGFSKIADHGREILHQQQQMMIAGMQNKSVVEATAKAWDLSRKIQVTTAAENLKHVRELRYATGNTEGALSILEPVTKANAILNAVRGGKGGHDEVFEMVKALEQKGLATSEEQKQFLSYVNAMTQAVVASGGRVTPKSFQASFKYGRTAMLGWDENFVTEILPRLIQSMQMGRGNSGGSGGPGNALMSGFRQIVSGVMSKPAAAMFKDLGLATVQHQPGTTKSYTAVKDRDLFINDPYEWIQQDLMPRLMAKYGNDQKKLIEVLGILFPNRTWGQAGTEMALQGRYRLGDASPFEKDRKLKRIAMGLGAYGPLAANDPNTIDRAYDQQKENALSAIGVALAPVKLEVVKAMTQMFTGIAKIASANPEAVKAIAYAAATLGGALVVGGVAALAAALGTVGFVAAGAAAAIELVGGAIYAVVKEWDSIKKFFEGLTLSGTLKSIADAAGAAYQPLHALAGVIQTIAGVLQGVHMPSLPHPQNGIGSDGLPLINLGHGPAGQKHSYYIPPQTNGRHTQLAAVYLDGRKVGDAVIDHIGQRASMPVEGSPHHDATWQASPLDFALG